jgi:large subunit ribosomal protein L22
MTTTMNKTAVAKLRYLKVAPRKVRSVAGLIRGLSVPAAQAQLMVQTRRAATPLMKLLNSAIANAENLEMDVNKLYISSLRVDQGPMLKRMLPKARGRGTVLQKIMSHVTLELGEKENLKQAPFVMPRRVKAEKGTAAPKAAEKPKVQHDHSEDTKVKESKGIRAKLFNRKAGEA